jgi:16S rRNA processing protein RimM
MDAAGTGPDRVVLARVRRPWGRAGELLLDLHTDWPRERFRAGQVVILARDGGHRAELRVRGYRELTHRPLLALEGVADIGAAEEWTGAWILAADGALDRLAADDMLQSEVIGLPVLTDGGEQVGVVSGIEAGPGADLYRVERVAGGELLVPADAPFCRLDRGRGLVLVDPPAGLLDPDQAVVAAPGRAARQRRRGGKG